MYIILWTTIVCTCKHSYWWICKVSTISRKGITGSTHSTDLFLRRSQIRGLFPELRRGPRGTIVGSWLERCGRGLHGLNGHTSCPPQRLEQETIHLPWQGAAGRRGKEEELLELSPGYMHTPTHTHTHTHTHTRYTYIHTETVYYS